MTSTGPAADVPAAASGREHGSGRPTTEPATREHKTNFSDIYRAPDPRPYYAALAPLEYQIPLRAAPILETVLTLIDGPGPTTVLDLCCSYGINSTLVHHPTGTRDLADRYLGPDLAGLTSEQLAAADRTFYTANRDRTCVIGLDVSDPAVSYGVSAGLLADGWCADLEAGPPSPDVAAGLGPVQVVLCTGGVGYITEKTFRRILDCVSYPERLWLIVFVLRVFDYADIRALLGDYGLVTEQLPHSFPQRRFTNSAEQVAAVDDVRRRGLDPAGMEADGWFYADCFLSRPAATPSPLP